MSHFHPEYNFAKQQGALEFQLPNSDLPFYGSYDFDYPGKTSKRFFVTPFHKICGYLNLDNHIYEIITKNYAIKFFLDLDSKHPHQILIKQKLYKNIFNIIKQF